MNSSNVTESFESAGMYCNKKFPCNKPKIIKNVIVLGLSYTFLFSAFMALSNLQSTLNNIGNIGVISQSLISAGFIISSIFLPKLVIQKFGCKTTIVITTLAYAPYIAVNIYPTAWTLFPTAFLLGVGGCIFWCSVCTYINDLSFLYADREEDKAKLITPRFFGILLMFYQSTQIWGNLVSYLVLKSSESNSNGISSNSYNSVDSADTNISCGANFCGGLNQIMHPPPKDRIYILVGIYFAFSILAAVVSAIFLDAFTEEHKNESSEDSVTTKLLATLQQMKNVDQLLLVALATFSGLQQGFIFGGYTAAYVACSWGVQNVGLVFVCYGVVDTITSFSTGYIVKYVPRVALFSTAAISNIGVIVALFNWSPSKYQPQIFFVIIGFWALSDGIWQTQITALYGVLFRADEEAAFANYRLWEALGYMIGFSCSGVLCIYSQMYILIIFLSVGYIGYIIVDVRMFRRTKFYSIEKLITKDNCDHSK